MFDNKELQAIFQIIGSANIKGGDSVIVANILMKIKAELEKEVEEEAVEE